MQLGTTGMASVDTYRRNLAVGLLAHVSSWRSRLRATRTGSNSGALRRTNRLLAALRSSDRARLRRLSHSWSRTTRATLTRSTGSHLARLIRALLTNIVAVWCAPTRRRSTWIHLTTGAGIVATDLRCHRWDEIARSLTWLSLSCLKISH